MKDYEKRREEALMSDGLWWRSDADPGVVLTREQSRAVDRMAAEELEIPGLVLMENAATAVAAGVMRMLEGSGGGVLVVSGAGNNGGDGMAAARKLRVLGIEDVRVVLVMGREKVGGDAAVQLAMCEGVGVEVVEMDGGDVAGSLERARGGAGVLVDAMFGTGLDRALRSPLDGVVWWMNAARERGARVLAVDTPSGMDADTGSALGGVSVRADVTVTLCARKVGMETERGRGLCGEVVVGGIGVPGWLVERVAG